MKMTDRPTYFTNILFMATCLALGCTSGGNLGCGSDSSSGGTTAPILDTDLLGIYGLDKYQKSEGSCDNMVDDEGAPSRIALYTVPATDNPNKAVLVGQFCGTELDCRNKVENFPQLFSYTFLQGSDSTEWRGWGLASQGMAGDDCLVEVQTHILTSEANQAIRIDTKQVETRYDSSEPEPGSDVVTCTFRDAIAAITDDSPCTLQLLLEATFESGL